jgi:hypothetical protein
MGETSSEATAGQLVEARSGGRKDFQPATVLRNNGDGTYNLRYSDGDEEAGVKAGLIRIKTTYGFYYYLVNSEEEEEVVSVGTRHLDEKFSELQPSMQPSPFLEGQLSQIKSKEGHALPLRHDPRELIYVFNIPRWWELCWFGSAETDAIFGKDVYGSVYGSFCNWYNNGDTAWSWSTKTTPTFFTGPGDTAPYARGVRNTTKHTKPVTGRKHFKVH